MPVLEIKNIHKKFGSTHVLKGIDFSLERGESIAVIGSSGSFSQRSHLPSSGTSTPSSMVDIPPPFDLACITKKPITKMEDLQGLKIRVPAVELQLAAFRSWGVEPHPLAWSETFNGLQQGVIDGQENPHSVNRDQKFWEVQKYITESHYLLWVGPILASEKWYRKLDAQTKALVDKAAKEAMLAEWKWIDEQDSVAFKACIDHGMQFDKLTDEPKWVEAARGVWPKFYDKVGGKELIDAALAIINSK